MMVIRIIVSTALLLTVGLCVCRYTPGVLAEDTTVGAEIKKDTSAEHQDAGIKSDYPVIGHLKTRDKIITIKAGPEGALYTVEAGDGRILALNLPAEELYVKFPRLKDDLERGLAGEDASYRYRKSDFKP
jgi:hypothetical protein